MPFVPVLLGTVRVENRTAEVARLVAEALDARHEVATRVIEPPFGNLERTEWTMDPRPSGVADFVEDMARADGFVLVFPEYNHGYPGALKNTIDHLYDEWNRKPFAFVSTGGMSGGLRAQENLAPIIRGVGAMLVPTSVAVQSIARGIDVGSTRRRIDAMIDDLLWWVHALSVAREPQRPPEAGAVHSSLVTRR